MAIGQVPGWPFITFGWGYGVPSSTSTTPDSGSTGADPWTSPSNPVAWYGLNRVWGTRIHSTGSVGYDKTYEVNYIGGWRVGTGNNVFLSVATIEEDL